MPPLPLPDPPSSSSSLLISTSTHLNQLFRRGSASRPSPASSVIALTVFAIIFALLGLGIVWWFVRRGGFIWKRNDWQDYVLTVTRKGGLADDEHTVVFSDGSVRKRGGGSTGTRTVVLSEWDGLDEYEKSVVSGEVRSGVGGWKGFWTRLRGGEWDEEEWDNMTSVSRRVPNNRRKRKRKSQPSSQGTPLKQMYYDLEDQTDAHSFVTQEPARVPGWTPEAEAELERERKAARQAELDRSKSFYAGDDRKLQRDEYKRRSKYEDYRRESDLAYGGGIAYPQSEPRDSDDDVHELPHLKPATKSVREKAEKKGPTIRPVQPSTRVPKRENTQKPMGARAAPFESKKRQSTRREERERVTLSGPREQGQPRRESTTAERVERRERRESRSQPHRSSTIATPTAPTSSRTSYPERSRTQHASQQASHAPTAPTSRHQPSHSQSSQGYGRDGGQQMYGSGGLPSEQNDPRRSYGGGTRSGTAGRRHSYSSSDSSDSSYDSSSDEEDQGTKAYPHKIDPPRVDLFREAGVGGESSRGGRR